ncbi:ERF family protein [Clostridium neonatale]|uniref:Essential recombination function protein n=1 Tax=Clostridium neonatale TaxID=137838 RepID=A0AAD2DHL2_9CLOT|nr:ERF family protein [Clostridium neonatale]CAI3192039.1 Essential recombination function protein [Clostridium neonatale]CAI3192195.1 Essential recombination function protein [Clostridium neonatale]CAI3203106.1 Essential recombination function protein [Clostridium neonatale]CAI3224644.1 Essential recombination function protein [Clostridium neonatale]CAI3226225.1 Essential recombination function protein [Clostridium neonatale]
MAEEKQLNIYQKLQKCRYELSQKNIKKSGLNKFSNYKYYELEDILPPIIDVCYKNGLTTVFDYTNENAFLYVFDSENPDIKIPFHTPVEVATLKGCSNIQNIGGTQTFCQRYLYKMAFEIAESDTIDGGEVDLEKEQQKQDEKQGKQYINKAAVEIIKALILQTNADEKAFLEWVNADKVEHIRNKDLNLVMKKLREKQAEQQKAKENLIPDEIDF